VLDRSVILAPPVVVLREVNCTHDVAREQAQAGQCEHTEGGQKRALVHPEKRFDRIATAFERSS